MDNGSEGAIASDVGLRAGARVFRSPVNRGFAPAVNAAVERCRGDVVALLNDDAVAAAGWLDNAAKALKDPSVAAVGPKMVLHGRYREVVLADEEWCAPGDHRKLGRQVRSVVVEGDELLLRALGAGLHRLETAGEDRWRWTAGPLPWYVPVRDESSEVVVDGRPVPPGPCVRLTNSAGSFLDRRGYAGDIGADTPDDGRFDQPGERFAVSGGALVARRSTWERVGPLADRFFAYYEDVDWCWRAQLYGMRVLYDPGSVVEHRRSASSGGEHQPWVRVMAERNRSLAMVRNGPAHIAAAELLERARGGADEGVRAGICRLLPWAVSTRAYLSRGWAVTPSEVWERWAGEATTWDSGPSGPGGRA